MSFRVRSAFKSSSPLVLSFLTFRRCSDTFEGLQWNEEFNDT